MTTIENNALSNALRDLEELASFAQGLSSRLSYQKSLPSPELITNTPHVAAAERTLALLDGTATPEQQAEHAELTAAQEGQIQGMRLHVCRALNWQIEDDSADAPEVQLTGEHYRAWLTDDRPGFFSGVSHTGRRWEATAQVEDHGDWANLVFTVTWE